MGPRPRPSSRASPSVVDRGAVSPEVCPQSPSASCGILEVPAGPRLVAEPAARSPTDLLFLQVGALGPFHAGTGCFRTRESPDPFLSALAISSHFRSLRVPERLGTEGLAGEFRQEAGDSVLRR